MKFSIILVNYNHADDLHRCIESALHQTYQNIELICVDDCSNDRSQEIIQSYVDKYENVHKVFHQTNLGPHCARIDGVNAATGDYILFLDSDDALAENCCEVLYEQLSKKHYDVVCYDAALVFSEDCSKEQKEIGQQYFVHKCRGEVYGDKILEIAYINHDFSHAVWNKCYARELMQTALEEVIYEPLFMNEDFYMGFVILSKAKSFLGIADKLYLYSFGGGISTAHTLSLRRFEMTLTGCTSNKHCFEYIENHPELQDKYKGVFDQNKIDALYGAYVKSTRLPVEDREHGMDLIVKYFGLEYTIITLAQYFWWENVNIAKQFNIAKLCPVTRKEIKTIGMFYHKVANGGVERVMSLLTPIFMEMGYRVVIITDEAENEHDFEFPVDSVRIVFNDSATRDGTDYDERAEKWKNCIEEHQIDAVIYHAWVSSALFWDMAVIKSTGAAFIVHSHNTFIAGLIEGWTHVQNSTSIFKHADAMCVLSKADRHYWRQCNSNVFLVQNPNTLTEHIPLKINEQPANILWLARFSSEKNPEDALYIMRQVLDRVPYATLTMVGNVSDEAKSYYCSKIHDMSMDGHVFLPGYSTDVGKYFSQADIFLATPDYEGAPMTFAESFAYHLPIVAYSLPYLSILENNDGVLSVPWKNIPAAADAIVYLLQNPTELKRRSDSAGKKFREMADYDYRRTWSTILTAAISPNAAPVSSITISQKDFESFVATVDLITKQMAVKLQNSCSNYMVTEAQNQIYNSLRYKVGKTVLLLPSKIRAALQLLKTRGMRYTFKFALQRAKGKSTDELLAQDEL